MPVEDPGIRHRRRQVERRLAAESGKEALGLLLRDDRLDRLDGQWLQVDHVRHRRVGHDRGRVRVDQDRADTFRSERSARLRPGVVELGRLTDDDRAGTQDQDRGGLRAGWGHDGVPWAGVLPAGFLPDTSLARARRGIAVAAGI